MKEIASTFREVLLPDGFHLAAAEIYRRMANFKDSTEDPPLNEVLKALLIQ
jgi:CRISPR/Cas system-associated protein endoribonuclease Cas2